MNFSSKKICSMLLAATVASAVILPVLGTNATVSSNSNTYELSVSEITEKDKASSSGVTENGFTFKIKSGKATLTKYSGSSKDIRIPSKVKGYSVTSIDSKAFSKCKSIKTVAIPNSVTKIGNGAFSGKKGLKIICYKGSYAEKYARQNKISVTYARSISKASVSSIKTQTYTAKPIKPVITVKYGEKTLKNGTDYTLTYKNNTNIGTASITVKGKGAYIGSKTVNFKIIAPSVSKPANLKAEAGSNVVKLSWSKASGASSYGVYVYNTKTGKYKGLATVTDTSYTVKNLKAVTTYKFAVRANKKVGSTTFHSSNAVSTVKTKFTKVKSLSAFATKNSVKLSWSKVNGASNYDVYQKVNGNWKKITDVASTTYTFSNLKTNVSYDFAVRANKKSGNKTYNGEFAFISATPKKTAIYNINKDMRDVANIVNTERNTNGLSSLKLDEDLCAAANVRAKEISQVFDHQRPDGTICFTVFDDFAIVYWYGGENIAYGYLSPEHVMDGWMNSPGHRANILNENFTSIGVGLYDNNGIKYWVQLFT